MQTTIEFYAVVMILLFQRILVPVVLKVSDGNSSIHQTVACFTKCGKHWLSVLSIAQLINQNKSEIKLYLN